MLNLPDTITGQVHSDTYVRARHYGSSAGRWTTKDPLGYDGGLFLYIYVSNTPQVMVDPSGMIPTLKNCGCLPDKVKNKINACTGKICDQKNAPILKGCAKNLATKGITADNIVACIKKWCVSGKKPECKQNNQGYCINDIDWDCCPKDPSFPRYIIKVPACAASTPFAAKPKPNPDTEIHICCYWYKDHPQKCQISGCTVDQDIRNVIHELGHQCSARGNEDDALIKKFADCVVKRQKGLGC